MAVLDRSATNEVAILRRLVQADKADLSQRVARYFLSVSFTKEEVNRMNELAAKARAGTLTSEERFEIDNYELIGHLLSILKSKARKSLKRTSPTS